MANPKLALATFIEMDPKVGEWIKRLSKKSENTAMGYASQLHIYWTQFLSKKFSSLEDWVSKVKADSRSEEYDVQTRWAKEVEEWVLTRTSERTGRPLGLSARSFYFWAVRSYLEFRLGDKALTDYQPIFADKAEVFKEREQSKDTASVTIDEVRKLALAANTRDRAVILCSMWGLGVGEFLTFANGWSKWADAIKAKKVPIKVEMIRPKTGIKFYTEFFDDAVDSLKELVDERQRELGHDLAKSDKLFVTSTGKAIDENDIQSQIRYLAQATGIEPTHSKEDRGKSYRVRPHEIGRDLFTTMAENKEVPKHIYDFCMGHTVDPLKYDKSPWTAEGEAKIVEQLQKLRPYLNILSGRGLQQSSSDLDEIADMISINVKINDKEACRRLFNLLCKKHPDLYNEAYERLPATGERKLADLEVEEKESYPILRALTRKELVMLAVEVASEGHASAGYEVKKISAIDEDAYAAAVAEGYSEAGRVNGSIIMRRGNN